MPSFDLCAFGWSAEHADLLAPGLLPGRVAAQHRGAYDVLTVDGAVRATARGRLLRAGDIAAVGDWVGLDGTAIAAVLPRRSAIVRNAAGGAVAEQVLAANVDVAFVVSSLGPDLEPRRLERYLTAVWDGGATPVVLLTKADLHADAAEQALAVETVCPGVDVLLVSGATGAGCDEVAARIGPGRTAVLLGSSGVGKSTLANRLAGAELRTQEVRADDDKGRHTTTHRQLVLLPDGGMLIDTPGLRELRLWDAGDGSDGFERAFADVEELARACRFGDCAHDEEPACAVRAAIAHGTLPAERLQAWRKLQRELRRQAARQGDERARRERRRELRGFARSLRKDAW